jgi:hypothetical protein
MTGFIESFATHQVLPPWSSAGVMTWGFVIRLEADRVQAYLDTYFNGAYPDRAPYDYSPIPGPQFGLLSAVLHPLMWSEYPGRPAGWDAVTVTEVYLGIPVRRRPISADNIIVEDPTIVWVQPLMFADNASVVFGSREIWGADMEFADIVVDHAASGAFHLDVAVEAIKTFAPRSRSELLACLHLRTKAFIELERGQLPARSPDLTGFLERLDEMGVFADEKSEPPAAGADSIELNKLKQFRDAYDMGAATYRAIVAARTSQVNVGAVRFFDCEEVEIDFMWSDSMAEMLTKLLGFAGPTDTGPPAEHASGSGSEPSSDRVIGSGADVDWNMSRAAVKAELAFWIRSDVHFEVLKTLHTYGV